MKKRSIYDDKKMSHLVHTGDFNLDIDIIGLLKRDYKDGNKSSYSVACCISHVTGTIFESKIRFQLDIYLNHYPVILDNSCQHSENY